jgi:hypothetical protein
MIHLGAPLRKPFKATAKSIKDAPFHKTASAVDEIKILKTGKPSDASL